MYVTGMRMPHTETSTYGNVSAMKSKKKYYDTHLISWRVCTINWKSELFTFQHHVMIKLDSQLKSSGKKWKINAGKILYVPLKRNVYI